MVGRAIWPQCWGHMWCAYVSVLQSHSLCHCVCYAKACTQRSVSRRRSIQHVRYATAWVYWEHYICILVVNTICLTYVIDQVVWELVDMCMCEKWRSGYTVMCMYMWSIWYIVLPLSNSWYYVASWYVHIVLPLVIHGIEWTYVWDKTHSLTMSHSWCWVFLGYDA